MSLIDTHSTPTTDPLIFTQAAASKVKQLIDEEQNQQLNLRVYISGGGCSGFQYGFTFDETINPDDTIITRQLDDHQAQKHTTAAVKLLVDPLSLQYLEGAEIDYQESVAGAQFVIRNPNAKTTCGCGSSFAA